MNHILGQKWDKRIQNTSGDFAYVVEGTARYWFGKRSPVIGYTYAGNKLIKNEIENSSFLSFQFVHGDGNKYHKGPKLISKTIKILINMCCIIDAVCSKHK